MPIFELDDNNIGMRHQDKVEIIITCPTPSACDGERGIATPNLAERGAIELPLNLLVSLNFSSWYPGFLSSLISISFLGRAGPSRPR